ncbi:aspartate/glutamate racemase family protein [Deefgea sp. CFH1-16]|uniref:aspartate/glutamate racemase family protein n=1 Tax=Deefgea sp. CFH1-16 TaxID=2675457 RepID=UPI0015F6A4E9|nr:aspartate/glutamate racemase family protein [Deefgea sp. CFH1-16]MBM5575480.1 amino acid racemase [Deefgea sp. CFH1-16]
MKTIGLIGGMSWESTIPYYRHINEAIKHRRGGLHSAKIILYSVDFHEIEILQSSGQWEKAGELLAQAARTLEIAGADCIAICTNTMHKVAPTVSQAVHIPLIHIADATGEAISEHHLNKIGLLGTQFTMEQAFYRDRLIEQFGLTVLTPNKADRLSVHRIIYDELCLGQIRPESLSVYRDIMSELVAQGAEGIILGCTEIALLVKAEDASVPLFDTAQLHAQAIAQFALS